MKIIFVKRMYLDCKTDLTCNDYFILENVNSLLMRNININSSFIQKRKNTFCHKNVYLICG